jgi:HEAT repeat protein
MKGFGRVFSAVSLGAIVIFFCVAVAGRPNDPLFKGKLASQWSRDLLSADYSVRGDAQDALRTLGEPAVPQLRELLQRRNPPWEKMILRLNRIFPVLNYQSRDVNACRRAAAETLGLLGPKAHAAAPDLVSTLAYEASAGEVERALTRIGSPSVVPLERALASHNVSIRYRAARLLREFTPVRASSLAALSAAADDSSPRVREQVASSLGTLLRPIGDRIGFSSESISIAVNALLTLSTNKTDEVRAAAMHAFGEAAIATPASLAHLNAALRDSSVTVTLEAAKSLWTLRQPPERIIPVLIAVLETRERWRAAYVLGEMGACAAPAVPALGRLLAEERVPRPFRTPPSSAFALGKIGVPAIAELARSLGSSESRIRMNALMAFGFMGKNGRDAVPIVIKVLDDKDEEVRHTAALTLASLGAEPEQMMASLTDCLQAEDIYMRSAAAAVLRQIAPDQSWYVPAE